MRVLCFLLRGLRWSQSPWLSWSPFHPLQTEAKVHVRVLLVGSWEKCDRERERRRQQERGKVCSRISFLKAFKKHN